MRIVQNAKPVSAAVGATLVLVGCLGVWLAAVLQAELDRPRSTVFSVLFAAAAVVQGVRILSWDRRSKPMTLVRAQASDALPGILPAAMFGSAILSVPEFADPANPALWFGGVILASFAISVVPAETAALSEVPPLRSLGFLDWLRWQDFGGMTLLLAVVFTATYLWTEPPLDALRPLIVVLALAQTTVSIWRIIEHRQCAKAGVQLSGMQIIWLRAIHVSRGHEAAAKEVRAMHPKISSMQADTIIENLYRAEQGPVGVP